MDQRRGAGDNVVGIAPHVHIDAIGGDRGDGAIDRFDGRVVGHGGIDGDGVGPAAGKEENTGGGGGLGEALAVGEDGEIAAALIDSDAVGFAGFGDVQFVAEASDDGHAAGLSLDDR